MKHLFTLALLFSATQLNAQITVTSADFAKVGDTARISMASDNPSLPDYTITGANQNWDFSALVPDSQRVISYRPISETNFLFIQPYFGPNADAAHQASYYTKMNTFAIPTDSAFPVTISDPAMYTQLNTSAMNIVGYSANLSSFPVAMPSDSIEMVYKFPMTMGDFWNSKGQSAIDLTFMGLAYKQYRTRESLVDGYGSITTPYGTFQAIRVNHTIYETDSIYLAIDTTLPAQWYGFDLPVSHQYEWVTNGELIPILKITTSTVLGFENITSIEYRDIKRDIVGLDEQDLINMAIFPNPAQDQVFVSVSRNVQQCNLYDMQGKEILRFNPNASMFPVNLQNLPAGSYLIEIISDGQASRQLLMKP